MPLVGSLAGTIKPMLLPESVNKAIAAVPPGRYAVAVSGGADSTALGCLLARRADLKLHLVHLNHQLRGEESDDDAAFVTRLADSFNLACTVLRIDQLPLPEYRLANAQARYRQLRLAVMKQVVIEHRLDGVCLAHHQGDVAETVLLRLIRGGGLTSLTGIKPLSQVGGMLLHRPLLGASKGDLMAYLRSIHQPWREDSSNDKPTYRRNVARQLLNTRPDLVMPLIALATAAGRVKDQLDAVAPRLDARFSVDSIRSLPPLIARHAVRRWLVARGAPADAVSPATCQRLIRQATDASAPPRQHYPGGLLVRRREKHIDIMP